MIKAKNITMEFDLNRGKVKSLKEHLFRKKSELEKNKQFKALTDVTFEVKKGEIFGIIGPNGSGKSTLLKIISDIMKPVSGKIEVNGKVSPMIELGAGFDFELSAKENIYLNAAILGFGKEYIDSKMSEIIEFSELNDFLDIPIKYFSSGMVAKLAFSISTIIEPEILILDEILSVGDMAFQKKSYDRMLKLINGGATVVFVSHDIDAVSKLCNKVMWLEKGKVNMLGFSKDVCEAYTSKYSG